MKLLFILVSIPLLVGCTITKRHFGPGYHVEWRKPVDKQKAPTKSLDAFYSEQNDLKEESAEETLYYSSDLDFKMPRDSNFRVVIESEKLVDLKLTKNRNSLDLLKTKGERQDQSAQREDLSDEEITINTQKTEPLTWISLILLFLIGTSLGMIGISGSILFVGAGVLTTCLAIAMFVCSLISLIRIKREPNRYKNKGLTRFVFSLSVMCLITAFCYLLATVALASFTPMMQGI